MIVAITEIVKKTYSDVAITWITLFNNSSISPVHCNKDRRDRLQFCSEAVQIAVKRTLHLFHKLINNRFNTNRLIVSKIYLTHAPITADVTAMPNGSASTMLC